LADSCITEQAKRTHIAHEDEVTVEKVDHLIEALLAAVINGMLMGCPLMLRQKFILRHRMS